MAVGAAANLGFSGSGGGNVPPASLHGYSLGGGTPPDPPATGTGTRRVASPGRDAPRYSLGEEAPVQLLPVPTRLWQVRPWSKRAGHKGPSSTGYVLSQRLISWSAPARQGCETYPAPTAGLAYWWRGRVGWWKRWGRVLEAVGSGAGKCPHQANIVERLGAFSSPRPGNCPPPDPVSAEILHHPTRKFPAPAPGKLAPARETSRQALLRAAFPGQDPDRVTGRTLSLRPFPCMPVAKSLSSTAF